MQSSGAVLACYKVFSLAPLLLVVVSVAGHLGNYDDTSIRAYLLLAAASPLPDLAGFHPWYEHMCVGTVTAGEMREDAEALAERPVSLHGLFRA